MDDNTMKVWLEIIKLIGILIGVVVTPLVALYVTLKTNKKLAAVETKMAGVDIKMDGVDKKLDENHKQQNGNLTKLIETTALLHEERGKQLGKEEQKNEENAKVQEAANPLPGATNLKIHEGELKVTSGSKKKG